MTLSPEVAEAFAYADDIADGRIVGSEGPCLRKRTLSLQPEVDLGGRRSDSVLPC
jgi:hypothetical protein